MDGLGSLRDLSGIRLHVQSAVAQFIDQGGHVRSQPIGFGGSFLVTQCQLLVDVALDLPRKLTVSGITKFLREADNGRRINPDAAGQFRRRQEADVQGVFENKIREDAETWREFFIAVLNLVTKHYKPPCLYAYMKFCKGSNYLQ